MSLPVGEIVTEELPDVRQNHRVAGRMQPVAAVVDVDSGVEETAGVAANHRILLDQRHLGPLLAPQLERGSAAGGTTAEDRHVGFRHVAATKWFRRCRQTRLLRACRGRKTARRSGSSDGAWRCRQLQKDDCQGWLLRRKTTIVTYCAAASAPDAAAVKGFRGGAGAGPGSNVSDR